jgi:Xaa-Pro aminopeptidase
MRGPKRMKVENLAAAMNVEGLDAVVAVMPENVYYITDPLIYTSWTLRERLALVVFPNGREPTMIVCDLEESLVRDETWIDDVRVYVEFAESPIDVLSDVLQEKGLGDKRIGIEMTYLAAAYYVHLKEHLPKIDLVSSEMLFNELRAVKSPEEVAHLKHAANVTEQAIYEAFAAASLGSTEKEVADHMNARQLSLGANENGFCIFGMGQNTLIAHHFAGPKQLEDGDLVGVDIGSRFDGYYSDVARSAVGGKPSPKQRDTYGKLRDAQRSTIAQIKPGVRACDVYEYCRKAFNDRGLELTMPHIGHSLGIGIHEYPMIEPGNVAELREGMIINIEPGHHDVGVGRYSLEDTVHVTARGPVIISDYSDTDELFSIK